MTDSIRLFLPTITCPCPSATLTSMTRLWTSVGLHQISQGKSSCSSKNRCHINNCWSEHRFPCVLPFSQMYPLCCIDIRNFLNQFYFFADDHFQHPNVIDETLKTVTTSLNFPTTILGHDANEFCIIVVGPTSFAESVQVTCWEVKLSVSGSDSPDSYKSRALRDSMPGVRATSNCCPFVHVCWWTNHSKFYWRISRKQENRWEANLWTSEFENWWLSRDSRIRLVCKEATLK